MNFFNLTAILIIVLSLSCSSTSPERKSRRQAWIESSLEKLRKFKLDSKADLVKIQKSPGTVSFVVYSNQVLVDSKGNWLYFLSHSSHADDYEELIEDDELTTHEAIGNISLAIDNNGIIYQSNKHPCGSIMNMSIQAKELKDVHSVLDKGIWFKRKE